MIIPLVKIFRTERYKNKLLALVTALRSFYGLSFNGTIRKRKITETHFCIRLLRSDHRLEIISQISSVFCEANGRCLR